VPRIKVEWERAGHDTYSRVFDFDKLREVGKDNFNGKKFPSTEQIQAGQFSYCRLEILDFGGIDFFLEDNEEYPDREEFPICTIVSIKIVEE